MDPDPDRLRIREVVFPDPNPGFLPIPDPGVKLLKKAPDPGSGSGTIPANLPFLKFLSSHMLKRETAVVEYASELSSYPVHNPTPP